MEIYHAATDIFTGIINPDKYGNPAADFGKAMYFGYTYDAALDFFDQPYGYILPEDVDDRLSDDYRDDIYVVQGFRVRNFGTYDDVANDDVLKIEFMRELVSHHVPEVGFPETEYHIYIGPRADRNTNFILKSNIHYPSDYDDTQLLMRVFWDLHCEQYSSQIAFKQPACSLFYEVYEENWIEV